MPPSSYTTADVARISGFSQRQLDYWVRQKIIIPSIQSATGSGSRRSYSFEDLVQLRFIWRLKNHGWSIQKIREAITRLRVVMGTKNSLHNAVLVHNKTTILAICRTKDDERIILDILDPHYQQVMWIFIENLHQETEETILKFTQQSKPESEQIETFKVA